jgi:dihydrofolate synthase / folylpolyglutamate synthase
MHKTDRRGPDSGKKRECVMTYQQTLEYLFNKLPAYHRIGRAAYKGDLSNTVSLDNYFGNPHRKFPSVHVAGTNGKGSVSHMTASVLQEAGYKTGLYTSPHLRDFRERIKINGEMIPEKNVIEFVEKNSGFFEMLKPSFFELTVAMAFDHFAAGSVDVAVIEAGLGGRLDSTNIINPVLSVITNIGHDHMDLLGNTLEAVAREKAGIIKQSVPVVISETQPAVKDIFISKAAECGSPVTFSDEKYSCVFEDNREQESFRKYTARDLLTDKEFEGYSALCGDYQARNLKAVFTICSNLPAYLRVSDRNISDGIRNVVINTGLAGRWQILGRDPLTICDTGHNKEGLEYVMEQIRKVPKSGLHMVIGFVNDKDLNSVLPLFPEEASYYFTRASIPRALNEAALQSEAARFGLTGNCYPDVGSALLHARRNASASDLIFIGGSTFIVAEAL